VPRTTLRVLATLELLQARGRVTGPELARHLGVDPRTVRRYVAALEELGIPVTAERGAGGGYELVAGFKLPPMLFHDEEALALSVGLLAADALGLGALSPGVASARAKLERVLPAALRHRARATGDAVRLELPAAGPAADAAHVALLAAAVEERRRVRLDYRAADGSATERDLDPYGVAWRSGRWYAVGRCHLRRGVRSFRVDRIRSVRRLAESFERPAGFDVLDHLASSLATMPRAHVAEILLRASPEEARRELFAAFGTLEPAAAGTLLRVTADDLDWVARELARLPFDFEIRRPAELRAKLAAHARRLARHANRAQRTR
jgi:predicted DNA-binding transcriptional regulator YafY